MMLSKKLESPLVVQLELTEGCNHRCCYCYNSFSHTGKINSLNIDQLKIILDQLIENDVFSLVLTGGSLFLIAKGYVFL